MNNVGQASSLFAVGSLGLNRLRWVVKIDMQMKKNRLIGLGLSLLLMLSTGCGSSRSDTISLYAGAGLRDAVELLRAEFKQNTGVEVVVDYAGSGVVLARVQRDPQADLFMPADVWYVDKLQKETGLVQESIPVTQLTPVLIVFKGNPKGVLTLNDLIRPDVKTAFGNPKACQIGRLSKVMVDRAGLNWDQVSDEESLTVNELAIWVKMKAVDAALVWGSTAVTVADSVEVIALDAAPDAVSRVDCALITTSPNPDSARSFIQFMVSPEGQALLEQAGFSGVSK